MDIAFANKAIELVREIGEDTENSYEHNLWTIANNGAIFAYRETGYAASMITWAQRKLRDSREAKTSNHVGEIKKRMRGVKVRVNSIQKRESFYGTSILHRMEDENGNVLIWWGTGEGLEAGDAWITIDATVKAHSVFNGVKQTVVNRVKEVTAP